MAPNVVGMCILPRHNDYHLVDSAARVGGIGAKRENRGLFLNAMMGFQPARRAQKT